jgi:aspartate-semialdehyde dehydrogenase
MPSGPEKFSRVAIVGASSLRGKELKQVLEDRNFPALDVVLLDESVMAGTLTEAGGEATFIRALEEDSFEGVRFAFFAGTAMDAEQNWATAHRAGATVIDLTGAVAGVAGSQAVARIPSVAKALAPGSKGGANGAPKPAVYSSPGAPVILACTVAAALSEFSPAQLAILLFPPVSERDQAGVDELESQTTNLLSFRPIERPVFDAQVAFNLLAGYGAESKVKLEEMRRGIARDVAEYIAGRVATPAIQLVQAPVFYGYAFAAYAEFGAAVAVEQLSGAFANLGVKVAGARDAAPSNVSVAGESEIQLAQIEADPNVAGGVWIWGVADNLRLAATNAVRIAEELVARDPAN